MNYLQSKTENKKNWRKKMDNREELFEAWDNARKLKSEFIVTGKQIGRAHV